MLLSPAAPQGVAAMTWSLFCTFSANILDIMLFKRPFLIPLKQATYGILNTIPVGQPARIYQDFVRESGLATYELVTGKVLVFSLSALLLRSLAYGIPVYSCQALAMLRHLSFSLRSPLLSSFLLGFFHRLPLNFVRAKDEI